MIDTERLAEILQGYGEIIEGQSFEAVRPIFEKGVWVISLSSGQVLRVEETALPLAVQGLLRLYIDAASPQQTQAHWRQLVEDWLKGEGLVNGEKLATALSSLGFTGTDAAMAIVAIQAMKNDDEPLLDDAVQLLGELLEEQPALVIRQGATRIYVLLQEGEDLFTTSLAQMVSGWLDTLGTELFLLCQAGISTQTGDLRGMERLRDEADFALMAGLLYRSKDAVHEYERLGLARVLYGLPRDVRSAFVSEVMPETVVANLTPELRETIFAFFEHGQQVADTARSLFIHRNTLLYRLDRIAELTGFDIRKPMQGWTIWLALTLSRTDSPNEAT
jgi:sugar diacid utilization regulator